MATKTFKVALNLDNPRLIQTGISVQSFDRNSVKISISLIKDSQAYKIPTGAKIKISMFKVNRQEQKIIADVPNNSVDSIDWIVPDYLDGYSGTVRCGVYLINGDENVDLGYFSIASSVSDIDSAAEEFTDSVMQGWDQIEADLAEIRATITQVNTLASDFTADVATKQADVTSKYNAFDTSVTTANQTVDDILALKPQFQAVIDETTGKDVISAPEIILARGGAETLGERLDSEKVEVSVQLAQTNAQVDLLNRGLGETFATLVDLQTAYPTGDTKDHIVGADGHRYFFNGTSWADGGAYQAFEVLDGAITRKKTNFYQLKKTNNLALTEKITTGGYYDANSGAWVADSAYGSLLIDNFDIKQYKIENQTGGGNRQITFWDDSENYMYGQSSTVINPPSLARKVRVALRVTEIGLLTITPADEGLREFYKDSRLYIYPENLPKETKFKKENMAFIAEVPSKINLFRPSEIKDKGYYHHATGVWTYSPDYFTSNRIPVKTGDVIRTMSQGSSTQNTVFFDENGEYLYGVGKKDNVVTPDGAKTVVSTFNRTKGDTPENVMVTINQTATTYYPPIDFELSNEVKVSLDNIDKSEFIVNNLKGKTLIATGDSIVIGENLYGESITPYVQIVADYFQMNLKNYGINGTTIAVQESNPTGRTPLSTRFSQMDDGDIIYVQCGTNDWNYQWTPVGMMSDRTVNTFYGGLHVTLFGLMEKYPGKQIIYALPIKRKNVENAKNALGLTLWQYCEIIKEVCGYYSIPVLDLYHESMINPQLLSQRERFVPDSTHPNKLGHEILGKYLIAKFRNLVT